MRMIGASVRAKTTPQLYELHDLCVRHMKTDRGKDYMARQVRSCVIAVIVARSGL